MKKFVGKLKKIVGLFLFVVVFAAVLLFFVSSFVNRNENKPTFLFGYSLLRVETGSMSPTIVEKSCILVKKSNGKNLQEGTIVTYLCNDRSSAAYGKTVTHRIVEKTADGYKTKGDYNAAADTQIVLASDIIAVYVKNLPVTTTLCRIFSSAFGLIVIVAVFLGSCAFVYIPDLIEACQSEEKAERAKEKEIEKRVREEVKKMQERDRNGRDS